MLSHRHNSFLCVGGVLLHMQVVGTRMRAAINLIEVESKKRDRETQIQDAQKIMGSCKIN